MLFINPSIDKDSQSDLLSRFVYTSFPTSIGVLAGYIRKYNSASVSIIDEHIRPITDTMLNEAIRKLSHPRIVGISCLTITAKRGLELARKIKRIDVDAVVIMGGIHATVIPEEFLGKGSADIVVRGEGEETLSELYELIKNGKSYYNIDGISFSNQGNIVHNKNRKVIENLDLIPEFPYDLFEKDIDKYRDFGTIITSRGCPYRCIFCSQRSISGRKYRFNSTERSLKEIGILINKYHQTVISFNEDNFLVNRNRVFALADGIISCGYNHKAQFIAELRADSVDRELLTKLKQANFSILGFGAETGSERLMKVIKKEETVGQINKAIKLAYKAGFKVYSTYIFGLPSETRKERKATFLLSKKLPVDNVRFNTCIPYPGTELYLIAKGEKRLTIVQNWANFNVQYYIMGDDIPYYPKNDNKYLLIYDTMMANLRTYISFRGLKSLIKSPLTGGGIITMPECLSYEDFKGIIKLSVFLFKRFLYIFYKSRIVLLKRHFFEKGD